MSPRPEYKGDTKPPPRWTNRIRAEREWSGIAQAELARRAGLDRRNLVLLETGRKQPSATTLIRIALALGIPVDALIRIETEPEP